MNTETQKLSNNPASAEPEHCSTHSAPSTGKSKQRIFEYMKVHPAFLATLVSAFVAIVAFVLNATFYRKTSIYLRYWGFNGINIDVTVGYQIYLLAMSLFLCLTCACITFLLFKTFSVYQKQDNILCYFRYENRSLFRSILLVRLDIWVLSAYLFILGCLFGKHERVQETKAKLDSDAEHLNTLSAQCKEAKQRLNSVRKHNMKMLLPSLLLTDALTFAFMLASASAEQPYFTKDLLFAALFLTILLDLLLFVLVKVDSFLFNPDRRKIKKAIKTDQESAHKLIENLVTESHEEYPVVAIARSHGSDLLSDKNIVLTITIITFSLVYVFFGFSGNISNRTTKLKTFPTTSIEGQTYAIIYNNGTTYYLDEAEITTDTIAINTSNQRIIVSNDMSYEVKEYTSVYRFPHDHIEYQRLK